jgi:lipid-A-disaccharide synthase
VPTLPSRASISRRRRGDVFVCAGEPSGDRIAAPVVAELLRRSPGLQFYGAGGRALRSVGVEIRHSVDDLAVTGISEALNAAGAAASLLLDTREQLDRRPPLLGLLVDYPGANLRLARMLHRRKVRVLYYVAPQRWAWLPWRVGALSSVVDHLAVTLPFEQRWFAERGMAATFVGHPLLETFRLPAVEEVRRKLDLDGRPILALLPGSRENEVRRHLPLLCKAVAWLPEVQPVLAVLPGVQERTCRQLAPSLPCLRSVEALALAEAALCASGTATLEAALAGVPTAVFYRLSTLSAAVAKQVVTVPFIALPNLLLSEQVMPELVQEQMTPANLATAVHRLLDPASAAHQKRRLRDVALMLGQPGSSKRVADIAEGLFRRGRNRHRLPVKGC